jgi:hypothetical protein
MALLAESLAEDWLNRDGYFTIRGVKHAPFHWLLSDLSRRDGRSFSGSASGDLAEISYYKTHETGNG